MLLSIKLKFYFIVAQPTGIITATLKISQYTRSIVYLSNYPPHFTTVLHKTDSKLYLPSVGGHQVALVLVQPSKYVHRPRGKTPAESSAEYKDDIGC